MLCSQIYRAPVPFEGLATAVVGWCFVARDFILMLATFCFLFGLVLRPLEGEELDDCSPLTATKTTMKSCRATRPESGRSPTRLNTASITLTLDHCVFEDYLSTSSAGGIARISKGHVSAQHTKFIKCRGVLSSCFYVEDKLTCTSCTFRENMPTWYVNTDITPKWLEGTGKDWAYGCVGVINNDGEHIAKLIDCTFERNQNGCVAGVSKQGGEEEIDVEVTSCTFVDNYFSYGPEKAGSSTPRCETGGNLFFANGNCKVKNCTFQNTEAAVNGDGWAIVVFADPTVTVTEGVFINDALDKGNSCILVYEVEGKGSPSITLNKCTFEGSCPDIKGPEGHQITIEESLQLSTSEQEACVGVSLTGGTITYVGMPCGGWPPPQPGEPTGDTSVDGGEEPGPEPEPGASVSDDPEGGGGEPEPGASDSGPVFPSGKPSDDDDDDDEDDDDDDDDSKGGKNKLSGGEIAAIVIVVLIVIAAIVAVLLFFLVFRRRYGSKSSGTGEEATSEVTTTEEVVTGTGAVNQQYGGDFGLWDSEAPESDPGSKEQ